MPALSSAIQHIGRQTNPPRGLFATLARMIAVQKQRNDLRALDMHQLQDVGLTEQAARKEAARSIWDLPKC